MKSSHWILMMICFLLVSCADSVNIDNRIDQVYKYGSVLYMEYKKSDNSGDKGVFGKIDFKKDKIKVIMNVDGQVDREDYSIRTVTYLDSHDELKYRTNKGDFHIKMLNGTIIEVSLYARTFMMIFHKAKPVAKIDIELPLPISTPANNWKRIEITDVGTIDMSPRLEIQSGNYKKIKMIVKEKTQKIWGIAYEEPKLILQPKGINKLNETSLSRYCRVILNTEMGNPNDFQHLNEKIEFTVSELKELNDEFLKLIQQGFANTPLKLIEFYPIKIASINGMPCIQISYKRQFKDQPFVMVDMYRFFNYDRVHTLTLSYRISDKEYWKSTLDNTLKSFRIININ